MGDAEREAWVERAGMKCVSCWRMLPSQALRGVTASVQAERRGEEHAHPFREAQVSFKTSFSPWF